jgi:hypothetical protein
MNLANETNFSSLVGVEFIDENGGGPGVRLRKSPRGQTEEEVIVRPRAPPLMKIASQSMSESNGVTLTVRRSLPVYSDEHAFSAVRRNISNLPNPDMADVAQREKAARRRPLNSNPLIADQAAINAGFAFRR